MVSWLWLHEHDKRVRADANTEIMTDSVKLVTHKLATLSDIIKDSDRKSKQSQDSLVAEIQLHKKAEAVVTKHTEALIAQVRQAVAQEHQAEFDSLITTYDTRLAEKDSMFAAQVRLTQLAESRVIVRDSAIEGLKQANATIYNAWRQLKNAKQKSLRQRVISALPLIAVTMVVTKAAF